MAPFLPRSDEANDAGYSPSQSNRGRDVGIIIACLAGIILTIFLLCVRPGSHACNVPIYSRLLTEGDTAAGTMRAAAGSAIARAGSNIMSTTSSGGSSST